MDFSGVTCFLYAEDMVKFVVREHGVDWYPSWPPLTVPVNEIVSARFSPHVGRLMVALAKDIIKNHLVATAPDVFMRVTSSEQFEAFARHFATLYLDRYDFDELLLLKVFTYITEFSILYHMSGDILDSTLEAAIIVIADILMEPVRGTYIRTGGLNSLNDTAIQMMNETHSSVDLAYRFGDFAWH